MTFIDQADSYIKTLKNPSKRGYAYAYSRWLFGQIVAPSQSKPAPERSCLSVMAAQAVRMKLHALATEDLGRPF